MEVQVWAGLVSHEASLPGSQMAAFSPCPQMAVPLYHPSCTPGVCVRISSSYKDTSLVVSGPTPMVSF